MPEKDLREVRSEGQGKVNNCSYLVRSGETPASLTTHPKAGSEEAAKMVLLDLTLEPAPRKAVRTLRGCVKCFPMSLS